MSNPPDPGKLPQNFTIGRQLDQEEIYQLIVII
jgi:hypothetical protein